MPRPFQKSALGSGLIKHFVNEYEVSWGRYWDSPNRTPPRQRAIRQGVLFEESLSVCIQLQPHDKEERFDR